MNKTLACRMIGGAALVATAFGCTKNPTTSVVVRDAPKDADDAEGFNDDGSDPRCELFGARRLQYCDPLKGQDVFGLHHAASANLGGAVPVADCLRSIGDSGESTVLPPLSVNCTPGPRKQCVITSSPKDPWEFSLPVDGVAPIWELLLAKGLHLPKKMYGHHQIKWSVTGTLCTYSLKVVADMDDDGVYSTYESGALKDMVRYGRHEQTFLVKVNE